MFQPSDSHASPPEPARRALDKLAQQVLHHPAVSLIDMGFDPSLSPDASGSEVVLRVHIRPGADLNTLNIPAEMDGIPVRIITGDYHLE